MAEVQGCSSLKKRQLAPRGKKPGKKQGAPKSSSSQKSPAGRHHFYKEEKRTGAEWKTSLSRVSFLLFMPASDFSLSCFHRATRIMLQHRGGLKVRRGLLFVVKIPKSVK